MKGGGGGSECGAMKVPFTICSRDLEHSANATDDQQRGSCSRSPSMKPSFSLGPPQPPRYKFGQDGDGGWGLAGGEPNGRGGVMPLRSVCRQLSAGNPQFPPERVGSHTVFRATYTLCRRSERSVNHFIGAAWPQQGLHIRQLQVGNSITGECTSQKSRSQIRRCDHKRLGIYGTMSVRS